MLTFFPYIVLFLFGIVFGSFLNVCIYRIPKKESIVTVKSHCMNCGYNLKWYDLVPLLSYIFLGGKCRKCRTKLSPQYPIVEAANGVLWCMVYAVYGFSPLTLLFCALFSCLLALSVIDFRTYEIPVGFNIFILILGIIRLALDYRNFSYYLIGFVCVSGFLFIIYLVTKGRGIGGGDIKLMAASGLLLGWKLIILSFMIGCILGAVIHVIRMKVSNEDHVLAMGPYLSMGICIAVLFGQRFLDFYFSYFS